MADDDMPPPLEDMTATLEQAKKLRDLRLGSTTQHTSSTQVNGSVQSKFSQVKPTINSQSSTTTTTAHSKTPAAQESTKSSESTNGTASSAKNKGGGDFAGMKKGFLFGGSSSQKTATNSQKVKGDGVQKKDDAIPFIKPNNQDKGSGLMMDEVQAAMESTKGFLQDKDWVTEDLLEKVQKNDSLGKRLGDPRFMQAVTEFQTNPKQAMTKYANNPEMQMFLKEFCGILGEHFTSIGDKQDATGGQSQKPAETASAPRNAGPKITEITDDDVVSSSTPDQPAVPVDPKVQEILADPANQQILMDSKIQLLIQSLRNNPEKAQRMLAEGDREFRKKVDHLISLGLLKFQA